MQWLFTQRELRAAPVASLMPSFATTNEDFGTCCRTPARFGDTYWMPCESLFKRTENFWHSFNGFRTSQWTQLAANDEHCTHPVLAERLTPGKPANIAVSVALMSILNTTIYFNALQVLVDSEKFDLSEPLFFHMPFEYVSQQTSWSLMAVDSIEVAMLIYKGFNYDDSNWFPLM